MSNRTDQSDAPKAHLPTALEWLLRVQSDQASAEDWAALSDWLEQSADHLRAYEVAERLSAEIDEDRAAILAALDAPRDSVVELKPAVRRSSPRWPIWTALAAACIAAVAIVGPAAWRSFEGQVLTYRTNPGETRSIRLDDGSVVQLDVASSMSVRQGWRVRRVTLGDAEATFDVAKDADRPFVITVGDQVVRVVGTEFNIRHYDRSTVITVRRGVVQVFQPNLSAEPIARLTKGLALSHSDGTALSTVSESDPDAAFGWTKGSLVCKDQPLSEIVAYLNRRYATPVRLSPAAAERRFSGVLSLANQADVVRHLSQYLSLSVDSTKQTITLR